jgi:hypothetical protein
LAASGAAVFLHVPPTSAPNPGEGALALDTAGAAAPKPAVSHSADTQAPTVQPKQAAQLADAASENAAPHHVRPAKPALAPASSPLLAPVDQPPALTEAPAIADDPPKSLQEQQLAETAAPSRPVQGPPVPDDLLTPIGDGASGTGLGIAGSARPASPPPVSRPGPGAGGPPRR